MTNADPPIACMLDAASLRDRLEWLGSLQERALLSHHRDGPALHLTYDAASRDEVRALVHREQNCCAFLRFQLIEGEQAVQLTITVPSDASEVADEILGYFEPAPSPRLGHNVIRSEGQKM